MHRIPAFGKLRQEDREFKTSLGYIVRSYLKKQIPKFKKRRKQTPSKRENNIMKSLKSDLSKFKYHILHYTCSVGLNLESASVSRHVMLTFQNCCEK
jgi:hypothetical protein